MTPSGGWSSPSAGRLAAVVAVTASLLAGSLVPASTVAADVVVVIEAGDSLSEIAAEYGVSISALMSANGISDPDRLFMGQELVIPGVGPGTIGPAGHYRLEGPIGGPPTPHAVVDGRRHVPFGWFLVEHGPHVGQAGVGDSRRGFNAGHLAVVLNLP